MKQISLCDGWQFSSELNEEFRSFAGAYEAVRLPHTVAQLPLHGADETAYQMLCGYRRLLDIPAQWSGKRVALRFDGAAHAARVFLNGTCACTHLGGYTAFTVELPTDVARVEILVELDSRESLNIPPFGYVIDYMTFGGLYREVWVEVSEPCFLRDAFVKTPTRSTLALDLSIEQVALADTLSMEVHAPDGKRVYHEVLEQGALRAEMTNLICPVPDAQPWSPDTPTLYTITLTLCDAQGACLDVWTHRFGFRQVEFRVDGFYLNGEKLKLRGLNRHQSYPYVGYAMPASMQRYDAEILKHELGCNAVRTSHYPQSHAFLDACDELGLLVFTELPGWQHIGDEAWKEVALEHLRELILQYRNHTSILLWGVRINESQDDDAFYARSNALARSLDDSRQTSGVRFIWNSNLLEDVYAFNDFSHAGSNAGLLPKALVSSNQKKPYLISEYNGHMFPTKSFDSPMHRMDCALRHATVLDAICARTDVAGGFGWCMTDYYTHGEFGSGDRICYHGVLDMFRNHKLSASIYAAQQEETPILVLASDMSIGDYPAGSVGENYAFTNADSIRFYKNDVLCAEFPAESKRWKHLKHPPVSIRDVIGDVLQREEGWSKRKAEAIKDTLLTVQQYGVKIPPRAVLKALWRALRWRVGVKTFMRLYQRYCENWGVAAPAYRYEAVKNGAVVATVTKRSSAKLHLQARASHTTLMESASYDVAAIRICIVDEHETVSPYCQIPVHIKLEGPATLIGPSVVTLEGGMCGTFVKTNGASGEITLTLTTEQTPPLQITLRAEA